MTRTTPTPSSQVNFRMPNDILQGIEELSAKNIHDRSSEINAACRHWIEIGGNAAADKTLNTRISELEEKFAALEKEIREVLTIMEGTTAKFEKTIGYHEKTIDRLLVTLPKTERE